MGDAVELSMGFRTSSQELANQLAIPCNHSAWALGLIYSFERENNNQQSCEVILPSTALLQLRTKFSPDWTGIRYS